MGISAHQKAMPNQPERSIEMIGTRQDKKQPGLIA